MLITDHWDADATSLHHLHRVSPDVSVYWMSSLADFVDSVYQLPRLSLGRKQLPSQKHSLFPAHSSSFICLSVRVSYARTRNASHRRY